MSMVEDTIRDVTGTIWGDLFGLPVQETPFGLLPIGPTDTVAGRIEISGGWRGLVAVHCARDLARTVAGLMYDCAADTTTAAQIADALGEVTNMTGGNLKTVLAEGCDLSQPQVHDDQSFTPLEPTAALVSQVAFECEGHPFVVSLFSADEAAAS